MKATLNLIHVGSAVLWAGGALFVALFVSPAARMVGDGAAQFMGALTRSRLADVMTTAAVLTVGSGAWLWTQRFDGAPPSTFEGVAISIGAIAGIAALALATLRQRPTVKAMKALGAEIAATDGPPSADQVARMQVLRSRMVSTGNLLAVATGMAVVGMALAG